MSDVDVVFVAEPGDAGSLTTATALARGLMTVAQEATADGALWQVDAALRPEGKSGALVRTLASHLAYYARWAATWEFQALLKARPAAGDMDLGRAYADGVLPLVWSAAQRDGFVADVQSMRRRVEKGLPYAQAEREMKLGAGGLQSVVIVDHNRRRRFGVDGEHSQLSAAGHHLGAQVDHGGQVQPTLTRSQVRDVADQVRARPRRSGPGWTFG